MAIEQPDLGQSWCPDICDSECFPVAGGFGLTEDEWNTKIASGDYCFVGKRTMVAMYLTEKIGQSGAHDSSPLSEEEKQSIADSAHAPAPDYVVYNRASSYTNIRRWTNKRNVIAGNQYSDNGASLPYSGSICGNISTVRDAYYVTWQWYVPYILVFDVELYVLCSGWECPTNSRNIDNICVPYYPYEWNGTSFVPKDNPDCDNNLKTYMSDDVYITPPDGPPVILPPETVFIDTCYWRNEKENVYCEIETYVPIIDTPMKRIK